MPNKAFLEITNVCNLDCSFCHKTKREKRFISVDEFSVAAARLRPFAEYLYFHLMGEPLLHPRLAELFDIAGGLGFKVILTTNGTRLCEKAPVLLAAKPLHKVSISLHCYEVNSIGLSLDDYLAECFDFCRRAAERCIIAVMRLWNKGGSDSMNDAILERMHSCFEGEWKQLYSGYKLAERIFLEWGELFDWPDSDACEIGGGHSCYGLRDQVGVLCDGSVVPCCLDAEGAVALGNIFDSELADILASPRAVALKRSFETRKITESLCRRCGFASKRF